MAKIAKTLRLESELIEQAQALQLEGETESALYVRLIQQGIKEQTTKPNKTAAPLKEEQPVLTDALQAHITDLQNQLEKKDTQIEALEAITKAAQALHGGAIVQALPAEQQKSRLKRAFFILTGKEK